MLRAAFVCPCLGVGGADGFMVSLMNNTYNIDWVGVSVRDPILLANWNMNKINNRVSIHQVKNVHSRIKEIKYHENQLDCDMAAIKDADVVISWCMPNIKSWASHLCGTKPIIDFAQNEDKHAKMCVESNVDYVHGSVACSKAAASVFPPSVNDVRVIYNAVDPARVTPRYGRDRTRLLWGIPSDKKIVTFLGRYVQEKNPEAMIQAISKLPPEWVLLFCGNGTPEYTHQLHEAAARYAPGRVMFAPMQAHVGDVLAAADVYCLPSDFEGLPLTMLESWLAGTPVVVSDFTCMQEIIEKYGQPAMIVDKRPTGQDLADAIIKADSQEFLPIVSKMRHYAWNDFTISTIAAQWEEYLHEIVETFRFHKRHIKVKSVQGLQPCT